MIETTYSGYSGRDYLNTDNELGAGIIWHVVAPQAGMYDVELRYSNGGSAPRLGDLLVNKNKAASFTFEQSGGWDLWQLAMGTVSLEAGDNRIDLVAMSASGLANIDFIKFVGHLTAGDCSVALSEGEALWKEHCATCHNSVNGDSVSELRSAIDRRPPMQHLKFLTDAQLQAIVDSF